MNLPEGFEVTQEPTPPKGFKVETKAPEGFTAEMPVAQLPDVARITRPAKEIDEINPIYFSTKEQLKYTYERLFSSIWEKPLFAVTELGLRATKGLLNASDKMRPDYPGAVGELDKTLKKKAIGWLDKNIDIYSQPEKYGAYTFEAETKRANYRAAWRQKHLAAGMGYDLLESGVELGALMIQMGVINQIVPTKTTTGHITKIGAHGFFTTSGDIQERAKASVYRIAYNITPYVANATGAKGFGAVAVDTALNTFLTSPTYVQAYKNAGGFNDEFLSMVIPQLVMDIGMAWNTRGLPKEQAEVKIDRYLEARPEATKLPTDEGVELIKDIQKAIVPSEELQPQQPIEGKAGEYVYHGSGVAKDIKEFRPSKSGELGEGLYITKDKKYAEKFFGEVYEGFDESKAGVIDIPIDNIKFKNMTKNEFISLRNKYFDEVKTTEAEWNKATFDKAMSNMRNDLIRDGYDGVYTADEKQGIVFPESINKLPQPTPQQPLIEEAKKYDSAEEFYIRTGGGKYNREFIDKLGQAEDREVVGVVGDLVIGSKMRNALGEDVLNTKIIVKKNISDKVPVLGAGGVIKKDNQWGKKGERIIFIDNKPSHIKTDVIRTILEEAAHTKRALMGREMRKIDLDKFTFDEYDNLPQEISAGKFVEFLTKIKEDKSQLTDIWEKAQALKSSELGGSIGVQTGEKATRGLSKGVEAKAVQNKLTDSFGKLPEYDKVNIKEQAGKAQKLVETDYEKAKSIAMGKELPPNDVLPESVFVAVENKAINEGDVGLLKDLATSSSLTSEASVMGQRIRTLAERNPESPVYAINEVAQAREETAKKRLNVKSTKKMKTKVVGEIKDEMKRVSATKETWADFIRSLQC